MDRDWERIETGLSPWAAYIKYVVKNKPERYSTASMVLQTLMRLQVETPEYADGVPAHVLIRAIVPRIFKHETSAYRVLGNLVNYNVIERSSDPAGFGNRTFYSIGDPIGSKMGPQFSRAILDQLSDNASWAHVFIERLLVQALAAREVLKRHGLIDEWVAECDAWASVPVIESGYHFGQTDQDVGFLAEHLSHASPFRP
jgi:hypothetical protein